MKENHLTDNDLVRSSLSGDKRHLELLIGRYTDYIYSIAYKMLWNIHDARDVSQEILISVVTRLDSFKYNSSFKTWLYRIAVNHTLNFIKGRKIKRLFSFEQYGDTLDKTPDALLEENAHNNADNGVLYEEVKQTCMSGMLMCLDNQPRMIFVIGELLGFNDKTGSAILGVSPENFRMMLSRAKKDLYHFMNDKCGLVNKSNPCRCHKKTKSFINAGYVNPDNLLFFPKHKRFIEQEAEDKQKDLEEYFFPACRQLFIDHTLLPGKDLAEELQRILSAPEVKALFNFN